MKEGGTIKSKQRRKKPTISNEVQVLIKDIANYVTENRLNNIISKIEEVT